MINYRKSFVWFVAFSAIISFLFFIDSSPVLSNTINIKMAHCDSPIELTLDKTNGEYSSTDIKAALFKKIIEEYSKGRINVKIYPACQLGGEREMLEMTKMGSLQMNACSGAAYPNFVPEVLAIGSPYIFRDANVALKVMNGPFGQEINELILKKMETRIFGWGFEGYWNIGNTKKSIRLPGDLKGMKIRVPESPNLLEIIKLIGGVPTPVSFSEVYTSLQQGVVDGALTGIGIHYMIKTYELIKDYHFGDFVIGWSPMAINEKFYQSLSKEDKYHVKEAALKALHTYTGMVFWGRDLYVDRFREKGVDVYFPTTAEREQWVKTLKAPMIEWTKKQIGSEWMDKVIKASEAAEKELYGE